MGVPDMVGDENNEHKGLVMVHMTKDGDIEGLSVVDTAIDPNLGGEMYHICELRKGICDVWTLVQVNGVNDEYLKVIFELLAQSRGLIRRIEMAKAFSWTSSTLFSKMEAIGFDCSLLYDRETPAGGIADRQDGGGGRGRAAGKCVSMPRRGD
jgi:hypothetical protein